MRPRRLLPPAAAAVLLAGLVLGGNGVAPAAAGSTTCPPGTVRDADVSLAEFAAGETGRCVPSSRPESLRELMAMNSQLALRSTSGLPYSAGAFAAGAQAYQAMAARSAVAGAPAWTPVGSGPLHADAPGYVYVNGMGLHDISGRIEDFAYDPAAPSTYYAAVANGGIWRTTDAGGSWRSIGDRLPTQITGAVELLRKGRSTTVLAGTGDPGFGGTSFSGLGVYWSTGNGAWTRSRGVPTGALTFDFDHDPARPDVVYAATSKGLYRSADAGRSFTNVVLSTGCTDVNQPVCFFANMVTDVVVRPVGRGSAGGQVLAAVGWRAGQKPNAVGRPQSPHNGLYWSATGAPRSFRFLSNASGFASDAEVGRVALGVATGPRQDHSYVYAVVQDALKFNKQATAFDIPEPTGKVPQNTVLNGLYGSKDFGLHWTKLADAAQLGAPGTGTALNGSSTISYLPGVQSWYNEWVQVDPTQQSAAGVPTRLAFGLEEVWTGSGALPAVPDTGRYHVVGRYWSGGTCGGFRIGALTGASDAPCPLNLDLQNPTAAVANQGSTTHADQHAGLWVPQPRGGVTLLAGNDGGAYKQTLSAGAPLTNTGWGRGINSGLSTLLPYDVAMSSDGTVVMGLQDNGSAVVTPKGKQIQAKDGDGFFVAIDPTDPKVWYEEYVGGDLYETTDGGQSWTSIAPTLTSALFATPFVLDPTNPLHLVIGGREVEETLNARDLANGPTWTTVFDLGTQQHPGDPNAGRSPTGPLPVVGLDPLASEIDNQLSAVDTRGNATYVGFCGYCDIVTEGTPFHSGIATNVGGSRPPKAGTSNGWHIAAAKGLPQRYVNSVRIDPANPRTVYVTLGGYARRWIPPGSLGDSTRNVGRGHVFKSTDAGRTFRDISGNLPDIPADDAIVFNGQLVVATDLGVFIGDVNGRHFQVLGTGLPAAPVFRVNRSPRNPRELVVASYGRGPYRIVVPARYAGQPARATSVFAAAASAPQGLAASRAAGTTVARPGSAARLTGGAARSSGALPAAEQRPMRHDGLSGGPLAVAVLLLVGSAVGVARRRRTGRSGG